MIKDFKDKIAVITGAGCGIGRSLAFSFAKCGMRIAIADINKESLNKIAQELRNNGTDILDLVVDVSDRKQVAQMADTIYNHFGKVNILCNNAGVAVGSPTHLLSLSDWDWVFGVNFFGILYGVKAFLPRMLKSGEPSHIVNTASIAGLIPELSAGPYTASKYATVGLSEILAQQYFNSNVKFSVLCPGFVKTDLHINSENLGKTKSNVYNPTGEMIEPSKFFIKNFTSQIVAGMDPNIVAEKVIEAISNNVFYIITHPEYISLIQARIDGVKDSSLRLNKEPIRTINDLFESGELAIYKNESPNFSIMYPNNWVPAYLPPEIPIQFMALLADFSLSVHVMDISSNILLKDVINIVSMFLGSFGSDVKVISNKQTTLKDNQTEAYEGEIEYKRNSLYKMKNLCLSVFKEKKLIIVRVSSLPQNFNEDLKKIVYSLEFK